MTNAVLFKKAYQIFSWVTLAGLVVTLVLVFRPRPRPQLPIDRQAAARAEQKFEAADQSRAAGQAALVELDRTELNSYLAENLQLEGQPTAHAAGPGSAGAPTQVSPTSGAPPNGDPTSVLDNGEQPTLEQVQSSVKDVKVDMDGDLVKAYVIFDFHGKDLSLELDGHLRAENGYLRFDPVSGAIGSMPLPQSALQTAVDKLMASPENREKLRLPADISDIQIQNGNAVITYK